MTLLRSSPSPHEPRSASIKNSLRRIPSSLFRTETGDSPRKDKHHKRKGLTNILAWARSESPPPPVPPISVPTSLRKTGAAAATFTAAKSGAGQKRSAPLKRRKTPAASAWAHSLRSTSTTPEPLAPEHKTRPSCPPDPFERLDSSYNSFHTISRPPTVNQLENASNSSVSSCAPNITTVSIDDVDDGDDLHEHDATFDDDSWVASLSSFEVAPLPLGFHPDDSVDVPFCPVPSRSSWKAAQGSKERRPSSLGRSLELTLDSIVETHEEHPRVARSLRREKTKSRVWGILTAKKKPPVDLPNGRPTTPSNVLQRPPIPVLQVTKPSNDSIQASPPKPRKTPSSHLNPSTPTTTRQQPTAHHAKGLPKRKSLSGLFGISLKRSSGRLRSPIVSPKSSPTRDIARTLKLSSGRFPSPTPSKATPSRKAKPPQLISQTRSNSGSTRKLHAPKKDCSPDTATFFSRFGNPKGSIKQADVTIGDTTCATTQLERFLASIDPSVSPVPLRKMRSAILPEAFKRSSVSKGPSSAASTPGKARRGRLSSSPGPPSPVTNLMKGVRSMLSTSPSPSPARDYSLVLPPDVEDEVKPRWNLELESPMLSNKLIANITPPTPVVSSHTESLEASQLLSACDIKILATPPSRLHTPLPGLPPLPPADRKVDRLAQRRQHGKTVIQPSDRDCLATTSDEDPIRASFDFTREVLNLERGDGRTSFIKALHHALSQEVLGDSPLRQYSPSAKSRCSPKTDRVNRAAPFEGQPAFQKFVEQTRTVRQARISPPPFTAPPPFALPPLPTQLPSPHPTGTSKTQIKQHGRHESSLSGLSFGSISSLGAPLGGSTLNHDYTNYFEANYTGISDVPPSLPPLASMPHYKGNSALVLSRSNHKHSTSASSTGSLAGAEISYVSGSIRCTSRASYLTRRPLQFSTASHIDHSMTHDRHQSNASSTVSAAFIARPAVGERMFERDESVRLESFHERQKTCWSFASYDGSGEAESLEESVFCATNNSARKEFLIKSRPLSGISASSSEENDTFSSHSPTLNSAPPRRSGELRSVQPRVSRSRPKPLKFSDMTVDTPGLDTAYTSADDSSLFSFDSRRGSTAPLAAPLIGPTSSSFSAFFPYSHNRHHSSIATGVKVDVTIPEENSQSSLRSSPSSVDSSRNGCNYWDEGPSVSTTWVKLNREAEDVYHENRDIWHSTIFTKEEMIQIRQPQTTTEIQRFLADSKTKYKPLELVTAVRTRKSSVSRVAAGPYNGPVPPLESRFRNKRHSADECDCERPVSALLLEFAREQAPQTIRSAPRSFKKRTCRGSGSDPDTSRQSVTNSVRRRNLGWSRRRRNSDSVSGSISSVQIADDEVFGLSQFPLSREKRPSFIYLANLDQEDVDDNGSASLAGLPPSPLSSRSRPQSRRRADVLITSGGSPVNLNLELNPSPLIERRDVSRLSYEPGQSPISMRPFQPTSRPAPPRNRKVSMASTTRTSRPSGARVALGDSTIPQVNHVILKSSSSPQLKTKSTYPSGRRAQPMPWAAQKENSRPHPQLRPMVLQPVPRATPV